MATGSIDEQISDLVVSKFQGISVVNGFQTDLKNVYRPPVGTEQLQITDCPAVILRVMEKQSRFHLRGAEEIVIGILAIGLVEAKNFDSNDDLSALVADMKKVIYGNEFWDNGTTKLARRTWISQDMPHETEIVERTVSWAILFHILCRADQGNLTQVKLV